MTTNVPGPRFPLFVLGRQMVEAYPYVPIGDNVRISIAIFSYLDRFSFGITADYSAAPDLDVLVVNMPARLLTGSGLDYDSLRAINPGIVIVNSSAVSLS